MFKSLLSNANPTLSVHRSTPWRRAAAMLLAVFAVGLSPRLKPVVGEDATPASLQYLALGAPAGTSQAVVVQGHPLVHTRQLLPVDVDGALVGEDIDGQVEQLLDNLDAVLRNSGSDLNRLIRVNVCAIATTTVTRVRERLAQRLDPEVRPTVTAVLTPLPRRGVRVALDAVAVADGQEPSVTLQRCSTVQGEPEFADSAILPRGGVAYLSGIPAEGGLTESAVTRSMNGLRKTLQDLQLAMSHVVQLRVFLRPAASANEVRQAIKQYFPDQMLPPVVFVEWLAPPPVEIELIAQLPGSDASAPMLEYYNPPETRPMQIFSRVALVRSERQIYTSSLVARQAGRGQDQALDVFEQLRGILQAAGSDLRHMAKATYYVCDDESARGVDRARLWLYDQDRPPSASKCMVHGVGETQRTLTLDMIAVDAGE